MLEIKQFQIIFLQHNPKKMDKKGNLKLEEAKNAIQLYNNIQFHENKVEFNMISQQESGCCMMGIIEMELKEVINAIFNLHPPSP